MDTPDRPPANRAATAAVRIRQRIGAHDARERRQRRVTGVLLVAVAVLLVNSLVGENGYLATIRARHEEAGIATSLARIRIENRELQDERIRLQEDPAAIEDEARRTLGVIRPGETVFVLHDAEPVPSDPPVR